MIPATWREVYERYFGALDLAEFEARLRFVVGKYVEHGATPSKFDGIGVAEEGDAKYDDPAFYVYGVVFALCVGLIASLIPALRGSRVEPVDVLRGQLG